MSAHPSIDVSCRRPPEAPPREGPTPRRRALAPRLARVAAASAILAISALPACEAGDRAPAGDRGPEPAGGAAAIGDATEARARLDRLRALFPGALGEGTARGFEVEDDRVRPVFSPPPRVAAGALRVELPRRAADPAALFDEASQVGVRVALEGASGAPIAIAGSVALYPGAAPGGADVVLRAHAGGLEDYVVLERRPAEEALRYDVELRGVAGLRLVANVLELLDAGGAPRIRVAPPYLVDAAGARHAATLSLEGCAADADPRPPWGRPVRPPGADRCDVVVGWAGAPVAYPALVDPAWSSTASPVLPRRRHTATRLASGAVLLVGGFGPGGAAQTVVELYDPLSSTFSPSGDPIAPRGGHTATYLGGLPERVLIAGGSPSEGADAYAVAALYAVGSGEVATGALAVARLDHTATLLPSGQVLVAGGRPGPGGIPHATAELYDLTANGGVGAFTDGGAMTEARAAHVAAVLPDGGVLIAGGLGESSALSSAERFDPGAASFSPIAGAMSAQRAFAAAAVLEDGRVLITGGESSAGITSSSADLFDAGAGAGAFTQTATPMTLPRSHHQATPILGAVLITGGLTGGASTATTEFFDPAAAGPDPSFAPGTPMPFALADHAATPLSNGVAVGVLVTGAPLDPGDAGAAVLSLQGLGLACASRFECGSGVCAGDPGAGVCCNTPCSDLCKACMIDKTGHPSGECQVVLDNTEVSQVCQNAFAFALTCINGSVAAVDVQECAPFGCDGQVCAAACDTNAQCDDGAYCDPLDQQCKLQLQNGDPCSGGGQCPDGFCMDGVCCNAACEGACQACDVPGAAGACVVVSGAPRGDRSCAGAGTACAGECDGQALECIYGSGPCGAASCVDGAWTHGTCAAGECLITPEPCAPYACDGESLACATTCAGSDACAEGFLCSDGACVDILEVVCEGHTRRFRSGPQEDCPGGFTCADNGIECRQGCASVNDCVAPLVCDASGACTPAPELPPLPDCAIGAAPGAPPPRSILPWALALALAGACRRRRPRA